MTKKKKKSILSFALTLLMAICLIPAFNLKAAEYGNDTTGTAILTDGKVEEFDKDSTAGRLYNTDCVCGFYSSVAFDSVEVDSTAKTVTFTNLVSSGNPGELSITKPDWTFIFEGTCDTKITVEEVDTTIKLAAGAVLTCDSLAWYGCNIVIDKDTTIQPEDADFSENTNVNGLSVVLKGPAPEKYTVTFESNGGSKVEAQEVSEGDKAVKPATDPAKDGYTFDGWYADKDLKTAFDFSAVIKADTTVYAKWTEDKKDDAKADDKKDDTKADDTKTDDKKDDTKADDTKDDSKADDKKDDTKADDKKDDAKADDNDVEPIGEKYSTYEGCAFYADESGDVRCYDSDGKPVINDFKCDGEFTYYFQLDGTAMKDRLSYHPDGKHVIYFDENGHEVFNDFAHVKRSIAGEEVDDYCFFDVFGHMYVDVITWDKTGTVLYYANPYGVMEMNKWFQFSDTVVWGDGTPTEGIAGGYGYANENGTLMRDSYTYDWEGKYCYMQGNGVALY